MKKITTIILLILIYMCLYSENSVEKYIIDRTVGRDGSEIIGIQVPGGRPPAGYVRSEIIDIETLRTTRNVIIIDDFPAFDWSYGCTATSAAIIAAYYDRNGYPNIYTGPTNEGIMPLNNLIWNESSGGEGGNGECPLSATHQGFDGLTSRGHVDNYWVGYGSEIQDPYITNDWTPHENANCTGDFMGTNQSYWGNTDGGTTLYVPLDGSPAHSFSICEHFAPPRKDGAYGFKQFIESRNYNVTACFNQIIKGFEGNNQGFTFTQYMTEIDANRPVLIHITGHTMVGFGYDSSNQTIYIKNTWDYSTHAMTWGGIYYDMSHYAVSVINLSSSHIAQAGDSFSDPIPVNSLPLFTTGNTNTYTNTAGNPANDVFYKIYLPYSANNVTISTDGSSFDTYLRIYNSSQKEIYFNDNGGNENCAKLTGVNFNANTIYYVCVEGSSANNGKYSLNIHNEGPELLTLECNDSHGDGWGGGSITVLVNGNIAINNFTFTNGTQATITFGVSQGDAVKTTFTPGSWAAECSFRILDDTGAELGAGDSTTNISFLYGSSGGPSAFSPSGLTASISGVNISLNWEAPPEIPEAQWMSKGSESNNDGIGTGEHANMWVAHKYTEAELAIYQGMYINAIKIFPREPSATYTLKIWGGVRGDIELYSQAVTSFTADTWNEYALNSSVGIPVSGPVFIGYCVDAPAGSPCGCDAGPAVIGGDLVKLNEQPFWDVLSQITTININWNIQAFVSPDGADRVAANFTPLVKKLVRATRTAQLVEGNLNPILTTNNVNLDRTVTAYNVYRNAVEIAEVGATEFNYTDSNLDNGTYEYYVTAIYNEAESLNSNSVTVSLNYYDSADIIIADSFENYQDFALKFGEWTLVDVDLSPTCGFDGVDFAHSESPMAYIVFNPAMAVPALSTSDYAAAEGSKYLASFAAQQASNNDWLISKAFTLGSEGSVNFFAKSATASHGLERFKVLVSKGSTKPENFIPISGSAYVEVPTLWTEYSFNLDEYANQTIRVAVQCVSNDAFVFMLDDFNIVSTGEVIIDESINTSLHANYPNPFNPETFISYSLEKAGNVTIKVYNMLGQKIKTLVDNVQEVGKHNVAWDGTDNNGKNVSSGVYLYRMENGSYSKTHKMVLLK